MTFPSTPLPGDPGDPAILIAPTGEAVDGRRLLAEAVGFGRALRRSGLQIDLASEIDFARALDIIDLGHRPTVREAGAAVFVRRRDDREVYDRVFDRYWRRRGRTLHHIVDPRTGDVADPYWRTVSVAAATCVDANTASTAAIVMGAPARVWLNQCRLPARLVALDGTVTTTARWAATGQG